MASKFPGYELGDPVYNLYTKQNMEAFHREYAYGINKYVKLMLENTLPTRLCGNNWGTRIPNRAVAHLFVQGTINRTFRDKGDSDKNPFYKEVIQSYKFPEYQLSAFAGIESEYDYRCRASRPFGSPGNTYRGLYQIGFDSSKNHTAYLSLYNQEYADSDAFDPTISSIPFNKKPGKITYDPYDATTRAVRKFSEFSDSLKSIRSRFGIVPGSNDDPVSVWGAYLYWNQGVGNGPRILERYFSSTERNRPITSILTPSAAKQSWITGLQVYASSGRVRPLKPEEVTIKEWIDAMRYEINVFFYISCNACVIRALNYEASPSGIRYPSILNNGKLDCTPLPGNLIVDGIGNFSQGAISAQSSIVTPVGNPVRKSRSHGRGGDDNYVNQNKQYFDTQASRDRDKANSKNRLGNCDCGFVADTTYEFEVKYRKDEQAINSSTNQKRRDWLYLEVDGNFDDKKSVLIYIK
jgi:hypothetical protein